MMNILKPILGFAYVIFMLPTLVFDYLMILPLAWKVHRSRARMDVHFEKLDKERLAKESNDNPDNE